MTRIYIIILGIFGLIAMGMTRLDDSHKCNWNECPFKGQIHRQPGVCGCEPDSPCWRMDELHFRHPDWNRPELEYIFNY